MTVYQGVQWQLKCSSRLKIWKRTLDSATATHDVRLSLELRQNLWFGNKIFMSWERTHRREDTVSPPLCVGLYKLGAGRHPGDIFRESIWGQSLCQCALRKGLRIFLNCALARSTDQTDHLVLCVTCLKLNKPSYILLDWSMSWAITLWRRPRSTWRSLRSATTNVHPQQRGGTHPLGPRDTTADRASFSVSYEVASSMLNGSQRTLFSFGDSLELISCFIGNT
jgi:hypothetical protein